MTNQGGAPGKIAGGELLILAAAVLWGTTGTAQAFAPAGAGSLAIGAVRLVIGGVALLALALRRGLSLRRPAWPRRPTFFGAASVALYQLCFFAAVARTGVAVGTVVAISSGPVIAGLLSVAFLGERPSRRWLQATALAVLGCTLLVTAGSSVHVDPAGVLLAVGAGASYAIYTLATKTLLVTHPPDVVAGMVFFCGALLLTPLLLFVDLSWLTQPRGLLVALHLGLVATALAYVLFVRGLQRVSAATAVTLALLEPLTAALLGVLVLGERLTRPALLGSALLFAGLAVLIAPVAFRPRGGETPVRRKPFV